MEELITQVEIPQYIIKIQMSDSRRTRYYSKKTKKTWEYDELTGKYSPIAREYNGPPYQLPAPKSKLIKVYTGNYSWKGNYLYDDEADERVVANPNKAGEPRYRKLSGNDFSSGYGSPHIRASLVRGLKDFYRPFVLKMDAITEFPVWVEWYMYTTIPKRLFDLTNFWFYYKYFEDALTDWCLCNKESGQEDYFRLKSELDKAVENIDRNDRDQYEIIAPVIPDDNVKYISKPGTAPILCPIDRWEDRKFVFKFYKDTRECITNSTFYNE